MFWGARFREAGQERFKEPVYGVIGFGEIDGITERGHMLLCICSVGLLSEYGDVDLVSARIR